MVQVMLLYFNSLKKINTSTTIKLTKKEKSTQQVNDHTAVYSITMPDFAVHATDG